MQEQIYFFVFLAPVLILSSKGKYIQLASGISYTLSNSGTLQGNAP